MSNTKLGNIEGDMQNGGGGGGIGKNNLIN